MSKLKEYIIKVLYAFCIVVVVAVSAVNLMYMKRKPAEINLELGYWNRISNNQELLLQEYLSIMNNDTIEACRVIVIPKSTFKRLIAGETIATRFCLNSIREALVLNHYCYGKGFSLSNRNKYSDEFLFDSLSKHLNPLWEMEK